MKLTSEQKQFIGDVYEKTMSVVEKFNKKGEIRVCFTIDERGDYGIRVYHVGTTWKRLASDDLWLVRGDRFNEEVFQSIEEMEDYAANVTVNQEKLLQDRIAALQEELATLKKKEA